MLKSMKTYLNGLVARFEAEEDGLALTEYLILLGLLTVVVIVAVALFGTNLGNLWTEWANWLGGLDGPPT